MGDMITHQHSEIITTSDATYEIEVGGFRDPINETIIIENLGETSLKNPRITINDQYDWFDEETMAKEATRLRILGEVENADMKFPLELHMERQFKSEFRDAMSM